MVQQKTPFYLNGVFILFQKGLNPVEHFQCFVIYKRKWLYFRLAPNIKDMWRHPLAILTVMTNSIKGCETGFFR